MPYSYSDIQLNYYACFESNHPPYMKWYINDNEALRVATILETNLKPTTFSNIEDVVDPIIRNRILHLLARNKAFAAAETFANANTILITYNNIYQQQFGITINAALEELPTDRLDYLAFRWYVKNHTREQIANAYLGEIMQEAALIFKDNPTLFAYQINLYLIQKITASSTTNNTDNTDSVQYTGPMNNIFYDYKLPNDHPLASPMDERPKVYFGRSTL